jgi:hypothetical protein
VLAREATLAGDTVEAENCYQHAEHYFRVMRESETGTALTVANATRPAELISAQNDAKTPSPWEGEGSGASFWCQTRSPGVAG